MSDTGAPHRPEIINSDDVIREADVEDVDVVKVKASLRIVYCALAIAAVILIISLCTHDTDLRAWATGLISSIAGAALAYGFMTRQATK